MDLNELRLEIDKIDDDLVRLFVQRMEVSARIADYKKEHGLPIFVPTREQEKLLDVAQKAGPEMANYTRVLYSMLFELSRGYQAQRNATVSALYGSIRDAITQTPKLLPKDAAVACMGQESELVCQRMFHTCTLMQFKSVEGILSAISQGLCSYGIVPLEHNIKQVYDQLTAQGLYIVRCFRMDAQKQYICVSRKLEIYPGSDRSTIRMALSDRPGALYKVLSRLFTLGISVVRLESQPIAQKHFEAMFYFDLETSIYSDEFVQLMCELDDLCEDFAYLGSYSEVV